MKKILNIILLLLLVTMGANAQGQTTDVIQANELTIDLADKDKTVYLEVSLKGGNVYSAYGVDITLPEGLKVASYYGAPDLYLDGAMYPKDRQGQMSHSLSYGDVTVNPLAVGCISSRSENMISTNGLLFYVGLVPTAAARAGQYEVKLTKAYLITKEAVKYKAPDTTARLIITNSAGIADLNNPDDTSSAIYSVEGVKVVAPQKGHVYIVDGKKMKF